MPFKDKATQALYLEKNKAKRAAAFKAWESTNREYRNAYRRARPKRRQTREEMDKANAYNKAWRAANREHHRAYHAAWREAHPEAKKRETERLRVREYGVTPEQFEQMRAAQHGRCAICGETPPMALHVDHDHDTGAVRALLCGNCNRGLGLFMDSPLRLTAAAWYLEKHRGRRQTA